MIPEYEHVTIRFIILPAPSDEIFQSLFFGHTGVIRQRFHLLQLAVFDLIPAVGIISDPIGEPAVRTAGLHDKGKFVALACGVDHLLDIGRTQASVALQIRPDHIGQDHCVLIIGMIREEMLSARYQIL